MHTSVNCNSLKQLQSFNNIIAMAPKLQTIQHEFQKEMYGNFVTLKIFESIWGKYG